MEYIPVGCVRVIAFPRLKRLDAACHSIYVLWLTQYESIPYMSMVLLLSELAC